jgi:hypothetical protein
VNAWAVAPAHTGPNGDALIVILIWLALGIALLVAKWLGGRRGGGK